MPGRRGFVAGFVTATVLTATLAQASFLRSQSASMNVATGALAAPTSLSAVPGCAGTLNPKITLTWTATTSAYATGYVIRRRLIGGIYATVATVSGRTTTTYTNSGLLGNTTYQYVVQASYASWTADSTAASATTPTLCP
jgi:hypothetical protein